MPKTYLFYDIETSGLNRCFDQVLQFAAIRTDENFNELETHEWWVKINPDCIPSPKAMITHRLPLTDINQGLTEYEAIQKIHALFNQPETITLGYNTLGFDDEFLRFGFYRNLLPPYTHQYANGCYRMDIYPIAVMYYLFSPDSIQWPLIENKISLKLEHLNAVNQWVTGSAHHALVDVKATIALAKCFLHNTSQWNYVQGYFQKSTDLKRMMQLPAAFKSLDERLKEAILVQGSFGARDNFCAPVLSLGQHQPYTNQTLWLRLDQTALQETTADNVDEKTFSIRKRSGEAPFLLPPHERYQQKIKAERLALAHKNKQWLLEKPKKLQMIQEYHQHYQYPDYEHVDIDAALYLMPFKTFEEEMLCRAFHRATPDKKLILAQTFSNPHLQRQAFRVLARNFPEISLEEDPLNTSSQAIDFQGNPHLTPEEALKQIIFLKNKQGLDTQQLHVLEELGCLLQHSS